MHRLISSKLVKGVAVLAGLAIILTGCGSEDKSGQAKENESRQSNYDRLVAKQPAATMEYSPTRATKNFWIETWNEPGKLAYVYLMNANGDIIGYYVFEGLPVSYCTSLIPPYQLKDQGSDGSDVVVPAPSIDGTYSSGSNCNTYYGKDASTGAYLEYTAGLGNNVLVYDQPLARQGLQPLGPTK